VAADVGGSTAFGEERPDEITAFLAEAEALFDMPTPRVLERWQGVYAKGPEEFLIERGDEGALVLAATTGIGMTTGLGLAEENLTAAFGWAPAMEGTS
jgi:hypothetical protein